VRWLALQMLKTNAVLRVILACARRPRTGRRKRALRHGAAVGSVSGAGNTASRSALPDERSNAEGRRRRSPQRLRVASRRLCDIFGVGPGNGTFDVGLTNRFARASAMMLFAVLSRSSTEMGVTSAPEIAMSLGTRAAGDGPTGHFSPHSTVKADRNGPRRLRPSVAAGGVSFASPFA
jgi:hypothetical protein